jgi:hypothetical protein
MTACSKSNTTYATCGAHEFTPGFSGVRGARYLGLYINVCPFVLFYLATVLYVLLSFTVSGYHLLSFVFLFLFFLLFAHFLKCAWLFFNALESFLCHLISLSTFVLYLFPLQHTQSLKKTRWFLSYILLTT